MVLLGQSICGVVIFHSFVEITGALLNCSRAYFHQICQVSFDKDMIEFPFGHDYFVHFSISFTNG